MPDPRNNADDAFAAFMSMGPDEWQGAVMSILGGGMFETQEDIGFRRAIAAKEAIILLEKEGYEVRRAGG